MEIPTHRICARAHLAQACDTKYMCAEMRIYMEKRFNLVPVYGISTWVIVMIVIAVILIGALIALSIYGKKLQARQEASQKELENASQSVSLLVIDKKRMKLSESGLPQLVLDQTPKYMRGRKVPIVKAKIGPRIMSLMCDERIFELIPVKKEIRAVISGIYIMDVKGLRSNLEARKTKVKFSEKLRRKVDELRQEEKAAEKEKADKKQKKKK